MEEGEFVIFLVCMECNEKCNVMYLKIIKMLLIMSVEVVLMRRMIIFVNE